MEHPVLVYILIVTAMVPLVLLRCRLERAPRWVKFFRSLGILEVALLSLLLFTLIFFGCLQIVLRNFFHRGIIWADPLMRHIVLWLGCLGAVLATSRMRHISIDVFTRLLPGRLRRFRDRAIYLATSIASSVLGMASLKLVLDERDFGEKGFLGVDLWILQAILPVAFFLISYRSLLHFFLFREVKPVEWEGFEAEES